MWSNLFVKTQSRFKKNASQCISYMNCMNDDHKNQIGCLNFSRAIKNSISRAQKAIVEK